LSKSAPLLKELTLDLTQIKEKILKRGREGRERRKRGKRARMRIVRYIATNLSINLSSAINFSPAFSPDWA
jgi:hypothetical protein